MGLGSRGEPWGRTLGAEETGRRSPACQPAQRSRVKPSLGQDWGPLVEGKPSIGRERLKTGRNTFGQPLGLAEKGKRKPNQHPRSQGKTHKSPLSINHLTTSHVHTIEHSMNTFSWRWGGPTVAVQRHPEAFPWNLLIESTPKTLMRSTKRASHLTRHPLTPCKRCSPFSIPFFQTTRHPHDASAVSARLRSDGPWRPISWCHVDRGTCGSSRDGHPWTMGPWEPWGSNRSCNSLGRELGDSVLMR